MSTAQYHRDQINGAEQDIRHLAVWLAGCEARDGKNSADGLLMLFPDNTVLIIPDSAPAWCYYGPLSTVLTILDCSFYTDHPNTEQRNAHPRTVCRHLLHRLLRWSGLRKTQEPH